MSTHANQTVKRGKIVRANIVTREHILFIYANATTRKMQMSRHFVECQNNNIPAYYNIYILYRMLKIIIFSDFRSRLQTEDNSIGRKAGKVTNMVSQFI